jgi:hypothetical protein
MKFKLRFAFAADWLLASGHLFILLAFVVTLTYAQTPSHATETDDAIVGAFTSDSSQAAIFPGPAPGEARTEIADGSLSIGNRALSAHWSLVGGKFKLRDIRSGLDAGILSLGGESFQIFLADGTRYAASSMEVVGEPLASDLAANIASARLADQIRGRSLELRLRSSDGRLRVLWRAILHNGDNYLRQEIEVAPLADDLAIRQIVWFDQAVAGARTAGSVDGSPVVAGDFFLGIEDPMAANTVGAEPAAKLASAGGVDSSGKTQGMATERHVVCRLERNAVLHRGQTLTVSFVMGVAPPGQMRRAFLYYLEHERAHPYRPFLHYNSWYDIAWEPFALNETNCMDAIRSVGDRFIKPYGIHMDSMVFDDGWDDPSSLWRFHHGFPNGFTPLAELCRQYHTQLGVWLSPFGGYGASKDQRIKFGREQGYELNAAGFSLAGPKYYSAFKSSCLEMIRKYGVNYFKFDGIASGTYASGAGAAFILDTEAMRRLMVELRQEAPELFINLTTGSWPSPFWLRYADSLWRQGEDTSFRGKGSRQQQWLTYRDSEVFNNIVQRAPLYPLNSLMSHGVAYSRHGNPSDPSYNSAGLWDDIHTYFASGTDLQELYIQPDKLSPSDWQELAEAAKWSRANKDVLVDTHWIGGNPSKSEVYGYASWSRRKGVVMLRNPDDQPHEFALDVSTAFELPPGAVRSYTLSSPWAEDAGKPRMRAEGAKPLVLTLKPFEVRVYDAVP